MSDSINLSSQGSSFGAITAQPQPNGEFHESVKYSALYGYTTTELGENISLAIGAKKNISGANDDDTLSYQASIAFESIGYKDKDKHKIIFGGGKYYSTIIPENIAFGQVLPSQSKQLSIDYTYIQGDFRAGLSIYQIENIRDDSHTDIKGLELFASAHLNEQFELSTSLATSQPMVKELGAEYKSDNYLDYYFRFNAKYNLSSTSFFNMAYSTRSGGWYTEIVGALMDGSSAQFIPIFSNEMNTAQLRSFKSLDLSYIHSIKSWPYEAKPLCFISIINAMDEKNEVRPIYNETYTQRSSVFSGRRSLAFGFVFLF